MVGFPRIYQVRTSSQQLKHLRIMKGIATGPLGRTEHPGGDGELCLKRLKTKSTRYTLYSKQYTHRRASVSVHTEVAVEYGLPML